MSEEEKPEDLLSEAKNIIVVDLPLLEIKIEALEGCLKEIKSDPKRNNAMIRKIQKIFHILKRTFDVACDHVDVVIQERIREKREKK